MTRRLRFVACPHRFSHRWAVYDDLHGYPISEGNNAPMAKFIANTHEAIWRERCRQWIKAEHRDDRPYLA